MQCHIVDSIDKNLITGNPTDQSGMVREKFVATKNHFVTFHAKWRKYIIELRRCRWLIDNFIQLIQVDTQLM